MMTLEEMAAAAGGRSKPPPMSNSRLDKYEMLLNSFREGVVHVVRAADGLDWGDEAQCLRMLLHMDATVESGLEWIKSRRCDGEGESSGHENIPCRCGEYHADAKSEPNARTYL